MSCYLERVKYHACQMSRKDAWAVKRVGGSARTCLIHGLRGDCGFEVLTNCHDISDGSEKSSCRSPDWD